MKKSILCFILCFCLVLSFVVPQTIFAEQYHVDSSIELDRRSSPQGKPPWLRNNGFIQGAYVKYNSTFQVTITPGYGDCNESYWELNSDTTLNLSSVLPEGEDFVYIYIDDSESSYPTPTLIGSTTEPSYSNTHFGWYNGDDRCIGVVWTEDSSYTIQSFYSNSDGYYICNNDYFKRISETLNPTNSWETLEGSDYTPVNATAVRIFTHNIDASNSVSVQVATYEDIGIQIGDFSYNVATASGWLIFPNNASRDYKWFGEDNDDNTFKVRVKGYRIAR